MFSLVEQLSIVPVPLFARQTAKATAPAMPLDEAQKQAKEKKRLQNKLYRERTMLRLQQSPDDLEAWRARRREQSRKYKENNLLRIRDRDRVQTRIRRSK